MQEETGVPGENLPRADFGMGNLNWPVSQYERPRAVVLTSSACVDKTTKIITEFTRKDPFFYIWNKRIKYCKWYHYEVNQSVLHVNC